MKLTRNKMDADDLVQETAIKAFRNFNSFRKGKSFKNWSFTILKNTFITKYNKRKKRNLVSTPLEELRGIMLAETQPDPQMNSDDIMTYLRKSIDDLSSKCKEPFEMFINGYSYKEISEYLDIPIGTVKSRINFARTKLKQNYINANRRSLSLSSSK